jgi:hypothetical protein
LPPNVNGMSTLTAPQSTRAGASAALLPNGSPGARRTVGPAPTARRPRLVTRALLLRFVSAIGSATSFYLLLSVVPLFAKAAGAGEGAAGLATSALWNLAYDAGMGLGAAGFGAVAAQTGYPASFTLTGVLMLAALAPALRDRRATGDRDAGARSHWMNPARATGLPARCLGRKLRWLRTR